MSQGADIAFATAAEQARRIADREMSSTELVRIYLDRIEAVDPAIGAYLAVDAEAALDCAAAIDAALARAEELGPLAGVPVALKDILVTTAASKILAGWIPPYDGTAVARLRAAGAVVLGKLNCDEFAMGSSNENSSVRVCRNPWNLDRVPGGSSGGSAAAVSAGLCAASLGTDTGGSIRQPAAMCGVVGIKPTYGRVSRYGVIAFASSLDQVGPLARSVEDAALMLEVLAGFDPRDATSIDAPVPRYRDALGAGVAGLTIGLPREYFAEGSDPEVLAAVREAVSVLEGAGAKVVDISLPHTRYAVPAYYLLAPAEASSNLSRYDGVRFGSRATDRSESLMDMYCKTRGEGFGREVKRRIMLGTFALRSGYYDDYYVKAQRVRTLIKRDFDAAFETVDVIASPVAPTTAFRIGDKVDNPMEMYLADIFTLSCNLAGLPGLSVPCGLSSERLPIGLQMLGKPLDEATLFRAAAAYEREAGRTMRPPEPSALPEVSA